MSGIFIGVEQISVNNVARKTMVLMGFSHKIEHSPAQPPPHSACCWCCWACNKPVEHFKLFISVTFVCVREQMMNFVCEAYF